MFHDIESLTQLTSILLERKTHSILTETSTNEQMAYMKISEKRTTKNILEETTKVSMYTPCDKILAI